LLKNRSGGRAYTNSSGLIECEIEPSADPTGGHASGSPMLEQYFRPLQERQAHVKMIGPWVADCTPSACCNEGKTENHPIFWIEADHPSDHPSRKVVEAFVFSDDSGTFKPPHAGENVTARLSTPFPDPPEHAEAPAIRIEEMDDRSALAEFNVLSGGGRDSLEGTVQSGTPAQGKDFYFARLKLGYLGYKSHSLRTALAGRGDFAQRLRSFHPLFDAPNVSVRARLEALDWFA
jgi:hypothetical protein